ncbi:MAG TPA: SAM-dependent methyltransferase, partial [Bacteroidia bacterium]|nr:SAM-dependent methyltransferase [Bacteroidia bacterium]
MQHKLIITEDGSHSLFVEELNEHYHSIHGAIKESKHVFIEAGLKHTSRLKSQINILEVGFGTGLNTFLTVLESQRLTNTIAYTALEAFPLNAQVAATLNYSHLLVEEANAEMA